MDFSIPVLQCSMKIGRRRETVWGMFTLVLLIGTLQLVVFMHPKPGLSVPVRGGPDNSPSEKVVRKTALFRFEVKPSADPNNVSLSQDEPVVVGPNHRHVVNITRSPGLIPPLRLKPHLFIPPAYDPLVFGTRRTGQGFLTIGIPSIRRPNTDVIYLYGTIQSILNTTTPEQRTDITVVIMLSDHNETYNDVIARSIYRMFKPYCDKGFIQVINPPEEIYPNFRLLKPTKQDTVDRVKWRAKQNIDFSYLLLYSFNMSQFYIQLEDDLICAENFTTYIQQHISRVKSDWAMLEFSRLGFIGKLFKNSDLSKIANLLLTEFSTKPGDLLLGKVLALRKQPKPIYADFSLFQHNGKFSSLLNKMMPSIDKNFKDFGKQEPSIRRLPDGSHPTVSIVSTFQEVSGYPPLNVYDANSTSYFWAKTPQRTEYLSFIFENPQNFSRIVISTGDSFEKTDSLVDAYIFVRVKHHGDDPALNFCANGSKMSKFVDGELDTKAMGIAIPRNIICMRIQPIKNSKTWVKFREIVLIP